jgi:hypothetical protein
LFPFLLSRDRQGAEAFIRLRVAGAIYALLCCWIAWAFARDLWGEREGLWAASLLGFFLIFDFPASAIPLASDLLMLAPHLAAVWMAWRKRAWLAGALAGVAFLMSPKGVFVLLACALWAPLGPLLGGFAAVTGAAALWLWTAGALAAYWDQVWRWGRVYAGATFLEDPLKNGAVRTLNWMGFHAAVVIAALMSLIAAQFTADGTRKLAPSVSRESAGREVSGAERRRWLLWLAISAFGVAAGLRFFPRYYFQVLSPIVLLASHGMVRSPRRAMWVVLLLLIPAVRFAPTYLEAVRDGWRDTAMDQDSRTVAAIVKQQSRAGDTLFVWGYRPEIYVYSGLHAATRFLDSQPLTGVPADRHLTQSIAVETDESRAHRQELARSRPTWVVDGLGGYNPKLAVTAFADLQDWMAGYREVGRSGASVVYRQVR